MSSELWTVMAVKRHADGGRTLTMRNESTGVVKTENYAAGSTVTRVVRPDEDPS